MNQPEPYRYVDADDFCLSARLLPDLDNGGFTETLSITIEGSDEPQSVHIPRNQVENLITGLRRAAVSSAGQAPATNHTDLRDRIRRAVCEAEGFMWNTELLEPDEYGEVADAVLAVLPAPTGCLTPDYTDGPCHCPFCDPAAHRTDRVGTLRWAADQLDRYVGLQSSNAAPEVEGARLVIRELRRLADETPHTQTTPETCAHCGNPIRRVTGNLAAWWVHDPGGNTVCDWARPATSTRATPPAAGARQDGDHT